MSRDTGIATCFNTACPSHLNCLRYQLGEKDDWQGAGLFVLNGKHSQKCRYFRKGKGL